MFTGTIAIAYGVVADIAAPSERGYYVGVVLCGPNVAPSLGPVLGGVLTERVGWRWIFWFLSILGGICVFGILFFLPETARKVVGNGSIAAMGVNQDLISRFGKRRRHDYEADTERVTRKLHIPNPMASLYLLFHKATALVLLTNAIFYMIYCCIQASLSSSFISIYHYNELKAGLVYLPFGFGCALASYASGRIVPFFATLVFAKDTVIVRKDHG
jgi:MFS family permease